MESARFGLKSFANELNPVACFILKGTIQLPIRHGMEISPKLEEYGDLWIREIKQEVQELYSAVSGQKTYTYIFARTIDCPTTKKEIPLLYRRFISRSKNNRVALKFIFDPDKDKFDIEIVTNEEIDFDAHVGTVSRGKAISPWTGQIIDGEYIKSEAQAGRMGYRLISVYYFDDKGNKKFRIPNEDDESCLSDARKILLDGWDELIGDFIPDEEVLYGFKPAELLRYGADHWFKMFTSRQLYSMAMCVRSLARLRPKIIAECGLELGNAIVSYLAIVISKLSNFLTMSSRWADNRNQVVGKFDRHDFAIKWDFGEMDLVHGGGLEWALNQIIDAIGGITRLLEPTRNVLFPTHSGDWADNIKITKGDAGSLPYEDGSLEAVVMDPPYYDNVPYAELSDFFYVWLKRTVGDIYPGWFDSYLTEKDQEAVMIKARFERIDPKRAKDLARADYERKMVRIFAEANRVLRDDGVLTVMFNHKKVEAWDTLARSLIEGGFQILTSWPVHTESQHSLHQAKKAASASTIMLACRKRLDDEQNGFDVWWEDIKDKLEEEVSQCAIDFYEKGIRGVDLMVAAFGPALSVISQHWPVLLPETDKLGRTKVLSPDDALDLSRKVVVRMLREGLLGGEKITFDALSDWYLMAWDIFKARSFPYDEGRRLAIVSGLQMDELKRLKLYRKSGSNIELIDPEERFELGGVSVDSREELESANLVDRAYSLMVTALTKQLSGVFDLLERYRMDHDSKLRPYLQALLDAIPRTKKAGEFILPEAQALDTVAAALGLELPPEPEEGPPTPQQELLL